MKKRFTDANKWSQPWFRKLPPNKKLIFIFLIDQVDCAGVWEIDFDAMSFFTGIPVDEIDLGELRGVERFCVEKVIMSKFISFQYGELQKTCRPHQAVFKALSFHGLLDQYMNRTGVFKDFSKGSETLEEKEQDKVKDQEKEKVEENHNETRDLVDHCVKVWNDQVAPVVKTSVRSFPLGHTRAGRIKQRKKEFDRFVKKGELKGDFKTAFQLVCENVIASKFLCGQNERGWSVDFDWLLTPEKFWKVYDGAYLDKQAETSTNEDHEKGWG